ncbi:glycosyltransferase [Sphingomonas sp. TREG-RG-20F-R18-01]|uniref:glycosyltransferase n=1 Tax=Sphingomonas sp. TREG-RG-20F-R18-01 TaxID=2914982 RepID=UPI001F56A5B0|nr:glycosyltransferase [Sphingomonas sp. TREG-RG-20F-R18-01]
MRTLFVTWDGPQVSYVESLFVPIFEGLAAHGFPVDILQFRWGDAAQAEKVRSVCTASGIGYRARPIWRGVGGLGPFATALAGGRAITAAARHFGSDLVMPRSLMPALATLAARGLDRPIVFDADGLQADERVDFAGLRPEGAVYRILRDVEAQIIRRSTAVLARSPRACDILLARAGPPVGSQRFHIVTNGRDVAAFHPGDATTRLAVRDELGLPADATVLVYAGSVGPQYRLDQAADLLRHVRQRDHAARLLVLSGSPTDAASALAAAGCVDGTFTIMRSAPADVPRYLAAADVGIAFRTPSFSMQAVAPVKVAEYLLCGLPVIGNPEIGDNRAASSAGVFFDSAAGNAAGADWVIDRVRADRSALRDAARRVGVEHCSLDRAVRDYLGVLRDIRDSEHTSGHSPSLG